MGFRLGRDVALQKFFNVSKFKARQGFLRNALSHLCAQIFRARQVKIWGRTWDKSGNGRTFVPFIYLMRRFE
jgi:hypothetical protein